MPILTTLLAVLAVSAPSQTLTLTLTSDARSEMWWAMNRFETGDRQFGLVELRGLLLDQSPTVAFLGDSSHAAPASKAIDAWRRSLGETVFRYEPGNLRPDVSVRLVSSIADGADDEGEVDYTLPADSPDGRFHAEIFVRDMVRGRAISPQEEQAVITHELGHILGLEDSEDGKGLMGAFDPENLVLTPTPTETLAVTNLRRDLRQELATMTRIGRG